MMLPSGKGLSASQRSPWAMSAEHSDKSTLGGHLFSCKASNTQGSKVKNFCIRIRVAIDKIDLKDRLFNFDLVYLW